MVKKKVVKNDKENGKFGQSNRTWILSEPFAATDMDAEQIAGEDTLEPIAGEAGWTEPVYFFDDRIDLLSFYNGQEDIISYAFSYFYSPADMNAELWIGTHEDIKVYINGDEAYSFTGINVYGDDDIYTEIEPISIKKGENTLMVKTLNEYSDYSFALNICETANDSAYPGNRIEGLKFYTDKDTTGGNEEPEEPIGLDENIADDFKLLCYPNPSADKTFIEFNLPSESLVSVDIYDIEGKLVQHLANNRFTAGKHSLEWNVNSMHKDLNPGMYVCTLRIGEKIASLRITIQ